MISGRTLFWRALLPGLFTPVLIVGCATTLLAEEHRPRVFITNSESWEVVGSAGGSGGTFASRTQGGARPQTAEIIKTFGERCRQVIVNNKQEKADYVVVLDHEGGKGYLLRRNKIAVFNKDGDAIVSRSTRSLGNSVQDGCDAIVRDWAGQNTLAAPITTGKALLQQPSATSKPEPHSVIVPAGQSDPILPVQTTPMLAVVPERSAVTNTGTQLGTVSVTSDPDGAEIFIDSVGYGHAPAILTCRPADTRFNWSGRATRIGPRRLNSRKTRSSTSQRSSRNNAAPSLGQFTRTRFLSVAEKEFMKSSHLKWLACLTVVVAASLLALHLSWIPATTHAFQRPFTPGTPVGLSPVGMTGNYVADFPALCGIYTVYHNDATVDFGTAHTGLWAIGGWVLGHVVANYPFQTPGVYHMHAVVDGVCRDNNAVDWGSHETADGAIYVFTAPVPVTSLACAPVSITVGQRSTCTVTLTAKAPRGGTQVRLMSPQTSQVTVPLTMIVPFNRPSATFRVVGVAQGGADVYASSGEQSSVVSAHLTVN
jgi:hypothetical protein